MWQRAIIQGRVQGVGFRVSAKAYADRLGIRGYARNLPDGSVELCADKNLDALLTHLKDRFKGLQIAVTALDRPPDLHVGSGFHIL